MKKAIIITSAVAVGIASVAFVPPTKRAAALDTSQVVESIYEQLVTEKKNEAFATLDNAFIESDEIYRRLFSIDAEDNPYDGIALENRGQFSCHTQKVIHKKGQDEWIDRTEYHITIRNGYDVDEAEAVTSKIAEELNEKAGENASLQEKFYILCSYIGDNFEYDHELSERIDAFNEAIKTDDNATIEFLPFTKVVETGYGKMVCSGFANLTYLTANKLGIDCKLGYGKSHTYNLVRFDSNSPYKICDLTSGRYGLVNEATYEAYKDYFNPTLAFGYSETQNICVQETSSKADVYPQVGFYLFHGYGLSPDKEKAIVIFMEYLLNPLVVVLIAIAAVIFITSSIREAHRRHLRRLRRMERMRQREEEKKEGELK